MPVAHRPPPVLSMPMAALYILALFAMAPQTGAQVMRLSPAGVAAITAPPVLVTESRAFGGDVTILEYLDYNCSVCKHTEVEIRKLLASDPHVRLIHKDWPIFGAVSAYAAYCAMAAAEMGRYVTVHAALMAAPHKLDSNVAVDATLRAAGVDLARLHGIIDRDKASFSAALSRNQAEAAALGLKGTPGLVIGDELIGGGLDFAQLSALVADVRRVQAQH